MIIRRKIGNVSETSINVDIDYLDIEWYETQKRILHKKTTSGREIRLKFLDQSPDLREGDILFHDHELAIVTRIRECECIIIRPNTLYQMAQVCYEIGNKHIALFYEEGELLVPYEAPMFAMLEASGFNPKIQHEKLLHQLRTTVAAHNHAEGKSLFSKILQLTSPNG